MVDQFEAVKTVLTRSSTSFTTNNVTHNLELTGIHSSSARSKSSRTGSACFFSYTRGAIIIINHGGLSVSRAWIHGGSSSKPDDERQWPMAMGRWVAPPPPPSSFVHTLCLRLQSNSVVPKISYPAGYASLCSGLEKGNSSVQRGQPSIPPWIFLSGILHPSLFQSRNPHLQSGIDRPILARQRCPGDLALFAPPWMF